MCVKDGDRTVVEKFETDYRAFFGLLLTETVHYCHTYGPLLGKWLRRAVVVSVFVSRY